MIYTVAADHVRLASLLRRSKRLGYCRSDTPVISELFNTADDDIFQRVKTNASHVLQPYLPQHSLQSLYTSSAPALITSLE